MPTHNLLRESQLPDDEIARQLEAVFGPGPADWLARETQPFLKNRIVTGRVLEVAGDWVRVDVGYKSEGVIPLQEWHDDSMDAVVVPQPGDVVELLLLSVEGPDGAVRLSYRRARQRATWEKFVAEHKAGDEVRARVLRRVAGGLLVDVGITAFLPASQVDLRRPPDVGAFVGHEVEALILIIDEARQNVVVSRRALLERQREVDRR